MSSEIIVALISFAGAAVGALSGVSLIKYRIAQLEKKVEKHNNIIERTYRNEEKIALLEQGQKVANHRIDDLEGKT